MTISMQAKGQKPTGGRQGWDISASEAPVKAAATSTCSCLWVQDQQNLVRYLLKHERHAHKRHAMVGSLINTVQAAVGHKRERVGVSQHILQSAQHNSSRRCPLICGHAGIQTLCTRA
jgi:hypothetical protein